MAKKSKYSLEDIAEIIDRIREEDEYHERIAKRQEKYDKGGRPPLKDSEKRKSRSFRCTDAEWDQIKKRRDDSDYKTITKFILESCLHGRVEKTNIEHVHASKEYEKKSLKIMIDVKNIILPTANNINQIAKKINAGERHFFDPENLVSEIKKTLAEFIRGCRKLSNFKNKNSYK